jgi:diguanylate cyclase (GGDEF)-like protein/PAS domain S-box-containing protein
MPHTKPVHGTILVVDDHTEMRDLLQRMLTLRGHTVFLAGGGREALELLRAHRVDLVLLDLIMPEIHGAQVLARIKQSPRLRQLPVVIISAESDAAQIARCIELGAEGYLRKPINQTLLHARVGGLLERHQLRARAQRHLEARLRGLSTGPADAPVPDADVLDHSLQSLLTAAEQALATRLRAEAALLELNLTLEQRIVAQTAELRQTQELQQRQAALLESILDSIGDGVVVADAQHQVILQNRSAERLLKGQFGALLPSSADAPRHDSGALSPYPLAQAISGEVVECADLVLQASGEQAPRWLSVSARPLIHQGGRAGGVAVIRDITAARQADLDLRASEQRYTLAARGANDGLWDWDLLSDQIHYSPRWKAMLGYEEHELGTSPHEWLDRIEDGDREHFHVRLTAHWRRLLSPFEHAYRIRHRDGSVRWMLCRGLAVWDEQGRPTRMAGSQTEITERKLAEQRLQHDALHDKLTGLPNRALFNDRLAQAIARVRRNQRHCFAVLFIDLDRFKVINDSLGHLQGDQLLIMLAERLRQRVRELDTVARLGGDEFSILIDTLSNLTEVTEIANRLQEALRKPFLLAGHEVYTSASIGIALSTPDYQLPEELLRDADIAMYHAKLRGKGGYALFEPAMRDRALNMLQLERDLRMALARGELRLHYQPIVFLEDQTIASFEALVRWQHPQRGMIAPTEFIPIAEETGEIIVIGRWVLDEACRQLRAWHGRYPHAQQLSVSVNVAGLQLSSSDLVGDVQHALAATGLAPTSLKLEITETALVEHHEAATAALRELRSMGVMICLDDFGTGYSSLSYLDRFPIDILKIDRSFIGHLGIGSSREGITQTIVTLAHSLGIQTVAEGVETDVQLERLRALSSCYGQGWLFARALDVEAVEALLAGGTGALRL